MAPISVRVATIGEPAAPKAGQMIVVAELQQARARDTDYWATGFGSRDSCPAPAVTDLLLALVCSRYWLRPAALNGPARWPAPVTDPIVIISPLSRHPIFLLSAPQLPPGSKVSCVAAIYHGRNTTAGAAWAWHTYNKR